MLPQIAATPPSIPVAVKLNVPEVPLVVAESGEEGAAEQIHAEDGEATGMRRGREGGRGRKVKRERGKGSEEGGKGRE